MLNFCKKCKAVYECDYPLDGCENILCDGEIVLMDKSLFNLIEELKGKCCDLHLTKTVDIVGSVNLYEICFVFCDLEKAEELYAKMDFKIKEERFRGKIDIGFLDDDEDEPYVFTVGIDEYFDDFLVLETAEKIQKIMALLTFLYDVSEFEVTEPLPSAMKTKLVWRGDGTGEY